MSSLLYLGSKQSLVIEEEVKYLKEAVKQYKTVSESLENEIQEALENEVKEATEATSGFRSSLDTIKNEINAISDVTKVSLLLAHPFNYNETDSFFFS